MKLTFIKTALIAGMITALGVSSTWAATADGTAGASSTGTTDITITIPQLARISDMTAITFPDWDGTGGEVATDDICVWSNTGAYNITATGDGTLNAFTITDGTDTIAYLVEWEDANAGAASGTSLTSGTALAGQLTSAVASACDVNGLNSTLIITLPSAQLEAAGNGTYTGQLTLVVAAE